MPENVQSLGQGVYVCVNEEHRFGTDAFLLADFAAPRRKDRVCDLGSGCGIIPLYWQKIHHPQKAYAVEIQPAAAELLRQGVEKSGVQDKVFPFCADLCNLPPALPRGQLDVVTCNPPYKPLGTGIESVGESVRTARFEVHCTLRDVCDAASSLLKFGGRFCLCLRPQRLVEVLDEMRRAGIEPKRLRFVQQHPDTAPWLILAEGKKGARPHLDIEPPLIIEAAEGGFSQEVLAIYRGREKGRKEELK